MAVPPKSLRAKLRGGSLAEVSEEELQQLSGQAGRAAPPTSPLEAGAIGAGPDSAKMAGTPAQQLSALRIGLQSGEGEPAQLSDVQRREQARRQQTEAEQQQIERGGRLQQVEDLGERVEALAKGITAQVSGSDIAQSLALAADTDPSIANDLNSLLENPANYDALVNINNKMGVTDVDKMLSADQILSQYQEIGDQITDIASQRFAAQTANVQDLDLAALGFTDINELADLVNVPVEELSAMSIEDLVDFTQAAVEDEYTRAEDLRAIISDPSIGAAERAEARKALRDLGAVGVKGVESDLDQIADQIENADTVTFAGEEIAIEDMLNDEYVTGVIANYLEAPDGDPRKEGLKETDPELAQWIEDNRSSLEGVAQTIDQGIKDFAQLQEENRALAASDVGQIDDQAMEMLFQDWGQIRSSRYQAPPALAMLKDKSVPQSKRANVLQSINEVAKEGLPSQVHGLSYLNEQQLDQAGATNRNSPEWQDTSRFFRIQKNISRADTNDPDQLANALSDGQYKSYNELVAAVQEGTNRKISGLFGDTGPFDSLGMDYRPWKGINNVQEKLKQSISNISSMSISSKLNSGYQTTDFNKVKQYNTQPNKAYDSLAPGALNDGFIDSHDITDIGAMDDDTLNTLFKSRIRPGDKKNILRDAIAADPTMAGILSDTQSRIATAPGGQIGRRDKAHDTSMELKRQLQDTPMDRPIERAKIKEALKVADKEYKSGVMGTDQIIRISKIALGGKYSSQMEQLREAELFGPAKGRDRARRQREALEAKIKQEQLEEQRKARERADRGEGGDNSGGGRAPGEGGHAGSGEGPGGDASGMA